MASEKIIPVTIVAGFLGAGKTSLINHLLQKIGVPPVRNRLSFRQAYLAGMILEQTYKLMRINHDPPMTRFLAEQLAKPHWFTIERAQRDLGYEPLINHTEGLHRTVAWLMEEHKSAA